MDIRLCGQLAVEHAGESLQDKLPGRQGRLLLTYLALRGGRGASRDELIDAVWQEHPPANPEAALRTTLSRVRGALPEGAITGRRELSLALGPDDQLDVQEAEAALQRARAAVRRGDWEAAEGAADRVRQIAHTPLLPGYDAPWLDEWRRRLQAVGVEALEICASAGVHREDGDPAAAEAAARELVEREPYRESGYLRLMEVQAARDNVAEALRVYEQLRTLLRDELGTTPGRGAKALHEELLRGEVVPLAERAQAGGAAPATPPAPSRAEQMPPSIELPTGVVTFLMTDIDGSTRLWEADPEAMARALELHDELIANTVEARSGRLLKAKGEGDATLSAFRRASEAVACATELQAALATTAWPGELELSVRIALHTGEAHERDGDYFGPALNRAARLRALGRGGATLLSQATSELARDRLPPGMQLVDIGRHELRGLSRAERVFELRSQEAGAPAVDTLDPQVLRLALPRPLQFPPDAPFVGRETELARLRELWAEVCAGACVGAVLAGEAGIGKTRLAAEVGEAVHAEGALVVYGRCDEGLAVPYQPFIEAFRPYGLACRGCRPMALAVARLAPELGRLLPELGELGEPLRADPESERFALFEAVAELLEAATREQPALVVLDDLHWAAGPTLLLLRHLIRSERPLRALFLGTYRATELDAAHPLAGLLADLQRDRSAQTLNIRGLDEPGIAALLVAAAGHSAAGHSLDDGAAEAAELAQALRDRTAGNPFFVRELLAHLFESGAIHRVGGRLTWDFKELDREVPEGLRQVIGQRVARLSGPARRALGAAAVAGPTFSLTVLERTPGEQSGVLDALDEAVSAGLLIDVGPGDYAFAHALVRETIYDDLSSARRMRLHRRIGEALEAVVGDVDVNAEALAHHFAEAAPDGQAEKAAVYALAAGRSATVRLGYEEAVAHYERGLEALELAGRRHELRCELLLGLGEAERLAGENQRSRETFQRAAELAREHSAPEQLARAALGLTTSTLYPSAGGVDELGAGLLDEALGALGEDSALRATLLANLSIMLHNAGSLERVRYLAAKALATARRVGDRDALSAALHAAAAAASWSLDPDRALTHTAEMLEVADDSGDRERVLWARAWRVVNLLMLGDLPALAAEANAFTGLVEELRVPAYRWWPLLWEAMRSALEGRFDDSERLALEAFSIGQDAHEEAAALHFGGQLFELRLMQGRLGELEWAVKAAVEQYPALPGPRCALAALYAELGREDEARAEFESLAVDDFAALPQDFNWPNAASYLAPTCAFLSDAARASILYERLAPYARYCAFSGWATTFRGPLSGYLALLAAAMARWEEADRHFTDALDLCAELGAHPFDALFSCEYARMLLPRSEPDDREQALALSRRALEVADRLGMASVAMKARDMLQEMAPTSGWRD